MLNYKQTADNLILQETLNCLPDPIIVVSNNKRIAFVNKSAANLCGLNLVGQLVVAAIRHPNAINCLDKAAEQKKTSTTHITLTDNWIDTQFKLTATPMLNSEQVLEAIVVTLQDDTNIDEADQMRRSFVANVSHELRSPLAALASCSETLKKSPPDGDKARVMIVDLMEQEIKRMNRLVSDLLSLSKVEANERIRPTSIVDIKKLLKTVTHTFKVINENQTTKLKLNVEPDTYSVIGDADQLSQVFGNLVDNAIKYGKLGGLVTISCKNKPKSSPADSNEIEVSVVDQGAGIDQMHIPRLTERFYRIDDHRSRRVGGTGLGLAIVKHIVQRHRGKLTINSTQGKGSVACVTLPASLDGENQ